MKLFLDVDGVLNSFGESPWEDCESHLVNMDSKYMIRTSMSLGQSLLELGFDIHWLTMWYTHANVHISPLVGFPSDLPVAGKHDPSHEDWKYDAVLAHWLDTAEPFVWIDDYAIPDSAEYQFPDSLLIRPNPWTGITQEDINLIHEWRTDLLTKAYW